MVEPVMVLCELVEEVPLFPIRGAKARECAGCRRPVWVSPSSFIAVAGLSWYPACSGCAYSRRIAVVPFTALQRAERADHMGEGV